MPTYEFLSDDWITESRRIREEFASQTTSSKLPKLCMNLVITNVPFGDTVSAHFDTTSGQPAIDLGHVDRPDITITADYSTAKAVLVDADMRMAMEAMQLGRIKVQGGMMKLMSLASLNNNPQAQELATRIREITA